MIFETKICGFWVGFEAKFKPSILKQDKGVWFSGIEMPENAVRQSLSAFQIVILLRMIPNSYAVEAAFRRKSRLLRIQSSVAVWWLKIKLFWQRYEQKLTSSLWNRVTRRTKTKNGLQAICANLWTKNRAKYSTWLLKSISVLCAWKGGRYKIKISVLPYGSKRRMEHSVLWIRKTCSLFSRTHYWAKRERE